MKFLVLLFILTSVTHAKDVNLFNHTLLTDVQKDIRTDNERFKAKAASQNRSPASVDQNDIQDESKMDKNIRQIGPRTW